MTNATRKSDYERVLPGPEVNGTISDGSPPRLGVPVPLIRIDDIYKNQFQELHCPLEWDNLAETELFTDCDQRTLDTVVRYLTGEGNDRLTCTTHLAECIKLHQFLHCNGPDYCKTFENLNKDYLLSLKCPDVTAVCKGKGKSLGGAHRSARFKVNYQCSLASWSVNHELSIDYSLCQDLPPESSLCDTIRTHDQEMGITC